MGLPRPQLQYRVLESRRWRFDLAWPEGKVACEVQGAEWRGGRHNAGGGMAGDYEKWTVAQINGWIVVLVTGTQVRQGDAVSMIADALAARGVIEWDDTMARSGGEA